MSFKYELGLQAKDKITDFKGAITGRAQYLTGCDRYALQAKSKDGAEGKCIWIDENAIQILKGKKISLETEKVSGGPNQWEETI